MQSHVCGALRYALAIAAGATLMLCEPLVAYADAVPTSQPSETVLQYVTSALENDESPAVDINEQNFPDAELRKYLTSQPYGADGTITAAEADGVTSLQVNDKDIQELQGVSYFKNITRLDISENNIASADLSAYEGKLETAKISPQNITADITKDEGAWKTSIAQLVREENTENIAGVYSSGGQEIDGYDFVTGDVATYTDPGAQLRYSYDVGLSENMNVLVSLSHYYTVHFVGIDGTRIQSVSVPVGGFVTAPEAPFVEGFEFTGWDRPLDVIQDEETILAVYQPIEVVPIVEPLDGGTISTSFVDDTVP